MNAEHGKWQVKHVANNETLGDVDALKHGSLVTFTSVTFGFALLEVIY